jgi:hypothetical protein
MTQYKIQQLVYTKLNQEDSPFDKKDFHTAFYPLDFLTPTDVLIIENHIYIPTVNDFSSKQVVYYQKIKGETYLFVLNIKNLQNELDTMGRGGIFICHVFIFPEVLWQQLPSPDKLMELVNEYNFNSRTELLNSNFIDKQTGNILPINLDIEKVKSVDKQMPELNGSFEIQLILNLIDAFRQENKEQKFIVNASENSAKELFNKLICFLPNVLKINVGWDTMYDGGRMMDNNKVFLAYHEKAPKGGSGSSLVHLSKNKIELSNTFVTNIKQSPFAKWIAGCTTSIKYLNYPEEAYKLSEALLANEGYDLNDTWNVECFAKTNFELIDKLFIKKCKKEFKGNIFKELDKIVSEKDKLFFVFDKLDLSKFAEYLLIIMDNNKISARKLENSVPQAYMMHNPILVLFDQLWKEKKIDITGFNQLSDNQKLQLNKYVLKSNRVKKNWYLELIKSDETLLNFYIKQYPKPKRIIKLFRSVLKMSESEINQMGFSLSIIRKVLYFKLVYLINRVLNIFRKKRKV